MAAPFLLSGCLRQKDVVCGKPLAHRINIQYSVGGQREFFVQIFQSRFFSSGSPEE